MYITAHIVIIRLFLLNGSQWMTLSVRLRPVQTSPDEYPGTFGEGPAETPTALPGCGQRKSRLMTPFSDAWRYL